MEEQDLRVVAWYIVRLLVVLVVVYVLGQKL